MRAATRLAPAAAARHGPTASSWGDGSPIARRLQFEQLRVAPARLQQLLVRNLALDHLGLGGDEKHLGGHVGHQAVVGVVSIGVSSEDVLFALSQSPLIPGGQALLVDKGRIVAARDHLYQGRTLKEVGLGSLLSAIKKSPKGTIAKVDLPGRGAQVVAWATTTTGTTAIIVEPRDVFLDSINRLARNARLAMIALAILAVAGAITIARRLSKPVSALTAAAQALEADEAPDAAQLEKLGRSRDDIGLLTRVFMRMAEQVAIREKKLREQVRAMRVEIDHSKRAESVEALTESDFFKDLQTRAGDMRQKMKEDLTGTATTADNSEVSDGATKEEA